MTAPVIALSGVGKRYWQLHERAQGLRSLGSFRRPRRTELWALRHVDLTVAHGETVGLIGRNGAGKSSLLRLLAGVSQPTEGSVEIRGRLAPLLSVGVGFHPEMSGRENVFVNAMLLGLGRREVERLFDDIVTFAELEAFIDTPVKFYSSGMFMRLGFSVAVHVEPDILLVDEVIAVGDAGFQYRCLERMRELHRRGTTIVFVSHNMHAVHLLCPRTVLLDHGRVELDGPTDRAIARYHQLALAARTGSDEGPVQVVQRELLADGQAVEATQQGQWLCYRTVLRFTSALVGPGIRFLVADEDGTFVATMQTPVGERWRTVDAEEEVTVEVGFRARLGGGGTFRLGIDVTDCEGRHLMRDLDGPAFYVPPKLGSTGPADLDTTITVDDVVRTHHRWARFGGEELGAPLAPPGHPDRSAGLLR